MNDRLVTVAGVLLAGLIVAGLFMQKPAGSPITHPISLETGANGYAALDRWLRRQQVATVGLTRGFEVLEELTPQTGNLLIITLPHVEPPELDEVDRLLDWVAAGNTALVMAALDDTPDWIGEASQASFLDDLEAISGTRFEAVTEQGGEGSILLGSALEDREMHLVGAAPDHPLLANVSTVAIVTDSVTSLWVPATGAQSPGVALLAEAERGVEAAWVRPYGAGNLVTVASASLLTNRMLGEKDNARLFANLIRWHLRPGGRLLFDDRHQGRTELYDPEAFFADPRVGYSVLFLLAFWFVYMIGTHNRLLPVRVVRPAPRQADYVNAVGGFMARKLTRVDAGLQIFGQWFDELRTRNGLAENEPPWGFLAASPVLDAEQVARLRHRHEQLLAGDRVDLRELHNQINRIREAMG